MAYLGRGLDKISNIEVLDNITFDGSSSYSITKGSVAFTPNSAQSCLISIDGVVQATNFTVSSSTIDFGVAIPSTSVCNFFLHYGTGVMTVPSDGSVTTAKLGDGSVTSAKLSAGKVLQVVSATKTDTQSFSSSSFSDITGLSLSITPSSTSSKILVFGYAMVAWDSANAKIGINLVRNTTNILIGDAAGSRQRLTGFLYLGTTCTSVFPSAFNYLDAPSTTSATTYKIQASSLDNTGNVYVNRSFNDTDNSTFARTASTITAMEISAW